MSHFCSVLLSQAQHKLILSINESYIWLCLHRPLLERILWLLPFWCCFWWLWWGRCCSFGVGLVTLMGSLLSSAAAAVLLCNWSHAVAIEALQSYCFVNYMYLNGLCQTSNIAIPHLHFSIFIWSVTNQ